MALSRPYGIDSAFPTAPDVRKQLASIYPREGVFPDPITILPAGIAYAGAGWTVNARPFGAALKRGGAPYSLAYGTALVGNDAVTTSAWAIDAAPASGSRIDRLCIRAKDASQGDSLAGAPTDGPGGAARAIPEFLTVTGVAGTPGVAPALPAGYEEIATITTPAGAASAAGSTIIQTYGFAHVLGAPIVVRNYTELDALSSILPFDMAYVVDKAVLLARRQGGGWTPNAPSVVGRERIFSATNTFTNPTSNTDFPVAADRAALTIAAFEKYSATTDLRVHATLPLDLNSGNGQIIYLALDIDGVDYDVARAVATTAPYRGAIVGTALISGVPRGPHAIKPQLRASASNITMTAGYVAQYTIEEV